MRRSPGKGVDGLLSPVENIVSAAFPRQGGRAARPHRPGAPGGLFPPGMGGSWLAPRHRARGSVPEHGRGVPVRIALARLGECSLPRARRARQAESCGAAQSSEAGERNPDARRRRSRERAAGCPARDSFESRAVDHADAQPGEPLLGARPVHPTNGVRPSVFGEGRTATPTTMRSLARALRVR